MSTADQIPKVPKMYTTRFTSGRGCGMFADTEIKAGVRILADELLFCIADSTVNEGIGERISISFAGLTAEEQQQFNTLHCPYYPTGTPLVTRYLANCFEIQGVSSGIFLKASRINNSCCPNAFFSWNQNLHRLTLHAMVDIPAAVEITICYIFPFFSLRQRQDEFRKTYGFRCDCPACDLETKSGQCTELRRQRMETLYVAVDKLNGGPSTNDQKELEMVLEFIALAEDDHLDGEFLSCMYCRAKECYEDRGSMELAMRYAEMELETDTRLLGEDHRVTEKSTRALEELKTKLAMIQQVE
ncbi:MAG: hypothetical protein Q9161_009639 [Pseudevernia consocians]